jgi:predicted nucleotidyltransferase
VKPAYLTVHGSHAYGLNGPKSDLDLRGFFFLPPEQFFGLHGGPEQYEKPDEDDYVTWEFRKFVRLAGANNPNILETLFTDLEDIRFQTLPAMTLRYHARDWFLSKKVNKTFGGYAKGQFLKLAKNIDKWEDPGVRKDAMHCVRLIFFAQQMLTEGRLDVKINAQRQPEKYNLCMAIRRGQAKPVHVYQWAEQQFELLDKLEAESKLPVEAKWPEIEAFVRETLESVYNREMDRHDYF